MRGFALPAMLLLAATLSCGEGFFILPAGAGTRSVYTPSAPCYAAYRHRTTASRCPGVRLSMKRKGFGPPPPKRNPMPKSQKRQERDAASKAYDDMAAAGIPEYNIFIKPKGTDDYLPAGVMAVPRSQQVSQAIFEQEENLKKAAFNVWDKLKAYDEFEYGYTLKMFPDDPVTPIEVRPPSGNAVSRFFEGLMSPMNTSGMKGPPLGPPSSDKQP